MTALLMWRKSVQVIWIVAVLLPALALAANTRRSAVRGKVGNHRSLKKGDSEGNAPAPSPQVLVETAFGDENNEEDLPSEEDEQQKEEVDYPEQIYDSNGNTIDYEDNSNGKDDEKDNEANANANFVKLPGFYLEIGMATVRTSRDATYSNPRDNYSVLESLIEEYFDTLFTQNMMGYNYLSSNIQATMFTSENVDEEGGIQTLLTFAVGGQAEYSNQAVPKKEEVRDAVVAFFINWGYNNELGTFLSNKGIEGATVTNLLVEGNQMPAFYEAQPMTEQENLGQTPAIFASPTDSTTTTTTTSNNADSVAVEKTNHGNRIGLAVGLSIFFSCLLIAVALLLGLRSKTASKCSSWYRATRDRVNQNRAVKRGWTDFEENSDTSVEQVNSQSADKQKTAATIAGWTAWLQRSKKQEEEPSTGTILRQIQVVVDNDHILRKGGTRQCYILPEDASGAIVSHQHSAATIPHSNFDVISPQKTVSTSVSDEESLADPVTRWAPPTRSRSKLYRERHYPTASPTKSTFESPSNTCSPNTAAIPQPSPGLNEDDCVGLVEWASYLNPCLLPASLFAYESERLDDIVANLPRNKSVLDANTSSDTAGSPLPPDHSVNPGERRRSSRSHRSSRSSSGSNRMREV